MLQSCSKTVPNKETGLQMDWQFSELGTEIWYPARVPGSVQEDLIANQLIPDPFIGNNEDSILWVEEKDWIYKANLRITAQQLTYDHIEMIFQGLDTYATILVNNKPILITENMFRQYKVDVKDFVVEGDNSLEIRFESPVNHNRAQIDSLPYKLPTDSENSVYQVGPLVRKAAYQFGWDFAPRIVTMGIWQPIELNLWDNYNITDLQFYPIQITDSLATYKAVIEIESDVSATVNIKVNDQLESFRLEQGINAYETKIKVRNPKLWWPNGFGEQNLYDFVVVHFFIAMLSVRVEA